ncbi:PKD domain-containing protein [Candidatus Poribacteria bacterium]|nr:PKD domain-containing protein [Candidatus Poribacteria bacterium]
MKRAIIIFTTTFLFFIAVFSGCGGEKNISSVDITPPDLTVNIETESLSYQAMSPVKFAAVVSGGDGDYSYVWDFNADDGYTLDGFQSNVQYIYPESGVYTVSVHAADGRGASGEADIEISVKDKEYAVHEPIRLRDISPTPDKPYVIEGYEITNPSGNGITLQRCNNVIIRDCYIHDCERNKDEDGQAILLENCGNITVQRLYLNNNRSGFVANGNPDHLSSDFMIENNVIVGCVSNDALSLVNVKNSEVRYNILYDNGTIWERRISGISFNGEFHDISIHNNLVVKSDSDGIECLGYHWQDVAKNVEVYENVLRDNGEQGVWFSRINDGRIHHNYMEGSHNCGVCFDVLVSDVLIDHNIIVRCGGIPGMKHHGGSGIGLNFSPDNIIQSNICVDSTSGDISISYREKDEEWINKIDDRSRRSEGNVIDGNVMCSSESNLNIDEGVSDPVITNNVFCQRENGRHYHGCSPDESNIKAKPLFRAPDRGDFNLLSASPGYEAVKPINEAIENVR